MAVSAQEGANCDYDAPNRCMAGFLAMTVAHPIVVNSEDYSMFVTPNHATSDNLRAAFDRHKHRPRAVREEQKLEHTIYQ